MCIMYVHQKSMKWSERAGNDDDDEVEYIRDNFFLYYFLFSLHPASLLAYTNISAILKHTPTTEYPFYVL